MNLFLDNVLEILLLIGIIFISIGFFMYSIPLGFIVTGFLAFIVCIIVWKEQSKGGD